MSKIDTPNPMLSTQIDIEAQIAPSTPWLGFRATDTFFENAEISNLIKRALFYARAGVPIHFQGTAGRGKTSLAIETARRLGRPVSVMTGNDWLDVDDMIGREVGQTTTSVVDKYIQRVRRSEQTCRLDWENSVLAEAMLAGHTLVYDEFTRSSAKANGLLLSVLEEGALVSVNQSTPEKWIHAHPDFRIILTSNPHDYAGVNASPDALKDRMITFNLAQYDVKTEAGIVAARTGIDLALSTRILGLVHHLHQAFGTGAMPSMRAAIMIAKIAALRLRTSTMSDTLLAQISADVLNSRGVTMTTADIAHHLTTTATAQGAS